MIEVEFNEENKGQLWEAMGIPEYRYDELCQTIEDSIIEQVKKAHGMLDKRPIMARLLSECNTVEEVACMMYMLAQVLSEQFERDNPLNDFMRNIKYGQ